MDDAQGVRRTLDVHGVVNSSRFELTGGVGRMTLRNGPWRCAGCGRICEANEKETLGGEEVATGEVRLYCKRCIPRLKDEPPDPADWWKRR